MHYLHLDAARCKWEPFFLYASAVKNIKSNILTGVIAFSTPEAGQRQELDWLIKDVLSSSSSSSSSLTLSL
jgi:hypothetical protein